jgi:prevent-host-death family protein
MCRRLRQYSLAMTRMTAARAKTEFAEVVRRAGRQKERIVVTSAGKPVVAVVPAEDLLLLERLIEQREDADDIKAVREWRRGKSKKLVPFDDVMRARRR